jgi:hypothetical protein
MQQPHAPSTTAHKIAASHNTLTHTHTHIHNTHTHTHSHTHAHAHTHTRLILTHTAAHTHAQFVRLPTDFFVFEFLYKNHTRQYHEEIALVKGRLCMHQTCVCVILCVCV